VASLGIRTARDALTVLFRHQGKMLVTFTVLLGAAVAYGLFAPKTYRAETRLLIRLGRESMSVDPAAAGGDRVSVSQSRAAEVQSELQILTSQDLVTDLVDRLGPAAVVGADDATRADAVQKIRGGMSSRVIEESYSIEAAYEDSVPERAERVLKELVDGYLDKHAKVHRTPGAHEFFGRELERLQKDLAAGEAELQQLRAAAGLVSPGGRESSLLAQLQDLDGKLAAIEIEIAQVRAADAAPENVASLDPSLAAVVTRLRELRLQEIELLSKYPENNRFVTSVREMIAGAGRMLEERRAAAEATAVARQAVLTRQRADVNAELLALGQSVARLAAVEREIAQLRDSHAKFAASAEQARIDRALEALRISNISVVQPAQLPLRPVAPKFALCVAVGILLGLFGAFAAATIAEVVDDTVRRPEDGANATGLASVAWVPDLPQSALLPPRVHDGKANEPLPGVEGEPAPQLMRNLTETSAGGGDAVITTSMAVVLAADLARRGRGNVLLVDGNLEDASLSRSLDAADQPGLGDVLAIRGERAKVRIQRLAAPRQLFLAAGTLRDGSAPVASGERIEQFVAWLRQNFSHVVIDLPPATDSPLAMALARAADQVLLVASCGSTRQQVLRAAHGSLAASGVRPSGVVLNRRRFPIPRWLYRRV
jgi:uncharacterized protein involved in exopolysaccharide biosynthesis/Mrp family chromosome partitioning ATPase